MQILEQELNVKTVHTGIDGTGVGDLVLNQFMPLAHNKQLPDICVFFWTNHSRLFHRTKRGINIRSCADTQGDPILQAAKDYYTHIWDGDYSLLEYTAIVKHFDRDILSQVKHATQIVHLWCFGEPKDLKNADENFRQGNVHYVHDFTTGVEVRPPLMTLALEGSTWPALVETQWANHMDSKAKNERLADIIKQAILGSPANT